MPLISSLVKGIGSGIGLATEGKDVRVPILSRLFPVDAGSSSFTRPTQVDMAL
jgi:hypothetical protein